MKSINKIMLAAGIIFQLSASLYADNWSNAFLAFGGGSDPVAAAQYVLNNAGRVTANAALSVAKNLQTNEGMAVGRWMASSNKNVFTGFLTDADLQAAAQALIASRSVPVVVAPTPSNPQTPATNSSWFNWFGGSSATCDSDVQAAKVAQQKADALKAAENQAALQSIAASSATGATLYNGYVDLILGSLQQAISGIADPAVQMQVQQYAQSKVASMKVTAQNSSRVLGKISSKKESKKNKKSRK
jgi:hypothetical protein